MKKADVILISVLFIISLSIFTLTRLMANDTSNKQAFVYYDDELIHKIDLYDLEEGIEEELILYKKDYPKLLDDVVVVYKNGAIKVEDEESPKHVCSLQGFVEQTYEPLICLPNYLRINIVAGDSEIDGVLK